MTENNKYEGFSVLGNHNENCPYKNKEKNNSNEIPHSNFRISNNDPELPQKSNILSPEITNNEDYKTDNNLEKKNQERAFEFLDLEINPNKSVLKNWNLQNASINERLNEKQINYIWSTWKHTSKNFNKDYMLEDILNNDNLPFFRKSISWVYH